MPQPRFQVSTSDSFGAPGVYIQQKAVTPPLRGIFRGTTGFVGECVRGPANKLVYCPTIDRFLDVFGGRDYGINGGTLRGKVWWALQGKRFGKFYVVRTIASDATTSSYNAETAAGGGGTEVLHIAARSPGLHGQDIKVKVVNASNGVTTSFNLSVKLYDRTWLFENISINGTDDNTAVVVGSDDATPIVLTKLAGGRPINNAANTDGADANGYIPLGATIASYTTVAGSDGTIADADFTGTGKTMETLHAARGIDSKLVAGRSNSAIKTKIFALAPTANLSLWLICPDSETVTDTTWVTELAGYRHRAIVPVFNHPYYIDGVTTIETVNEPHAHLAGVLSQIEYDIHPGVADTAELNTEITRLAFELQDGQRDNLDLGGSTYMNRDVDPSNNDVFLFGNGRTADLTLNNSQVDGERSKMYLIMGLATRMRGDEKKPNTPTARAKRKGAFEGWLTELADAERFVDKDDQGNPQFTVVNNDSVNTATDRKNGIQRDLVRVALIPKNLYLQLQIEAGTSVVITDQG
jgi:hypothetical protein